MKPRLIHHLIVALLGVAFMADLHAQTTTFTYQGQLTESGIPATGLYDLAVTLYGSRSGPTVVGGPLTNSSVAVSNGLFTIQLDFGSGVFDGRERWLELGVASHGGGDFTTLTPRQQITSTAYAIQAANAANAASAIALSGTVAASQLTGTISSNNIGAGSITTIMLADGAVKSGQLATGAVTTTALANGAVTADKITTVSNLFTLTIANPTPTNDDHFGNSVAVVRTGRVLIGASGDDTGAINSGVAYLYSMDGTLLTTYTNPTPENHDWFGNAVSGVGADAVLIGAYRDDTGASDAGAAYLFSMNGTLLTTYTNPTPASGDTFGFAVSGVGADKVLIGAYQDDTGSEDAGAAYLYSTNGTLLATYIDPTPEVRDNFGNAVSGVGADKVLIGAERDNTGAFDAGAAYLYSTNGTLLVTFTNPAPAESEYFGSALSAVGPDRVLIGAKGDDTGATDAGVAYLFSANGTLLTTFTNPAPASGDQFGSAVSGVGADKVLIGAYLDDTGATNCGVAYLFSTNGTLLTTYTNPAPASGDRFGNAVSAQGVNQVLIAAGFDDTAATDAGVVYIYTHEAYIPGLIAESVRPGAITTASLAAGAVNTEQLAAGAVTAVNIASRTITSDQIADGAVTADKIAANAVTADKVANSAITGDKIAGNAVTAGKIADGTITEADIAPFAHLPGTLRWRVASQASIQAFPNSGFLANSSGQVAVLLPGSPSSGDIVRIVGMGPGGWKVVQNAGQSIITTSVGGQWGIWTRRWSGGTEALACSADATKLLASAGPALRTSTDSGLTWTLRNTGVSAIWSSVASSADGTKLAAVGKSSGPILISTDSGATWTAYETGHDWRAVACSADGTKLAAAVYGDHIYTSTNSGATWVPRGSTNSWIAIAASSDGLRQVAATIGGEIYVSYDSGVNWVQRHNDPFGRWHDVACSSDGTIMYAVGADRAFYYSEDAGLRWSFRSLTTDPVLRSWNSVACSSDGRRVVVAGGWTQIYVSNPSVFSWAALESQRSWNAVVCSADGSKLYAAGEDGIFSPTPITTPGISGYLSGDQDAAVELLYLTDGQWRILSHEGVLNAF